MSKFTSALAAVLSIALLPLSAAPCLAAVTALPFAHEQSDLKSDPAVRWGRLDNGVRYAIMHNARPRGRASLRLGVMSGSLQETEAQRGLAHFLEHLAFNGSTHFPPDTLVEYFQRQGMSFGGDTNASTQFDRTIYQLELPLAGADTLQQAFTLFADYQGGLLLKPESIEQERGIILSETRDRDSQGSREWLARMQFVAPDLLVTKRLPIGLPEVIRSAKREQFVDYYDAWYRPENLIVVAVGDFDVAKVQAQIVKTFSPLKARTAARPVPDLGKVAGLDKPTARFYHQPEAAAVTIGIDVVQPAGPEPDTLAQRLNDLPANIAQALLLRRLDLLVRKEGSAIAAAQVQFSHAFDVMRQGSIDISCREKTQWQACLAIAEQELRRAIEHGFQPAELQEVIDSWRNQLVQSERGAANRPSAQLADGLVDSVIDRQVFTTAADDRAQQERALDKITSADCVAALRRMWNGAPHLWVSGNLALTEQDIIAAYAASLAQPVADSQQQQRVKFAYDKLGVPGEVAARREVKDLGITLLQFKNGVRLNLKRTDFEAGRVNVGVRFGGGSLSAPRDQPGLQMLVSRAFIAGGLGKHSTEELRALLAGKNVSYRFAAGGDAFLLNGATTPEDLLLELQLLNAFVTDPGYRPEALREFQQSLDGMYADLSHSIAGPQTTEIPALLANGDPRFIFPDKAVLLRRNFDEVRGWLGPQLANGPIEISIVGDIDLDQTVAAVAQTFGALPPRGAKADYAAERLVSFPKEPLNKQYTVSTELQRALVDVRWPATDSKDARRARGITVLTNIFSDRLRIRLREQMGQAYSPTVRSQLSDTFTGYGFIAANASVAPEQARAVADVIKDVAADLAEHGVTEDELQRAKEPVLSHLGDSERQNAYWIGAVISGVQESPQQLDWHRSREADYRSISKAEVGALAKQYLDPSRASQFLMLPQQLATPQ